MGRPGLPGPNTPGTTRWAVTPANTRVPFQTSCAGRPLRSGRSGTADEPQDGRSTIGSHGCFTMSSPASIGTRSVLPRSHEPSRRLKRGSGSGKICSTGNAVKRLVSPLGARTARRVRGRCRRCGVPVVGRTVRHDRPPQTRATSDPQPSSATSGRSKARVVHSAIPTPTRSATPRRAQVEATPRTRPRPRAPTEEDRTRTGVVTAHRSVRREHAGRTPVVTAM